MTDFKAGDDVRWESNGIKKKGRIVVVVPAHEPAAMSHDFSIEFDLPAKPRDHDSYLVSISRGEDKKPSLYWPIVSKLRAVKKVERQTEIPGTPDGGPLGRALREFVVQAQTVAEEKKALRDEAAKIMEEMRKAGKESLTVEAAGEKYVFKVREQSFKLDWHKVKGE